MPRNRDYWNILEAHIRENPHDLLGMNTAIGANELRKLTKLIARYGKIHKTRSGTISYIIKKLHDLKNAGFIESLNDDALRGICELTEPAWDFLGWDPLTLSELIEERESRGST